MTIKYFERGLISSESKIIECVEGSTQFKYEPRIEKDPNSFLWVGRLDKNKDPLTILKAFNKYIEFNRKAKLTMFYENTQLISKVELFIKNNSLSKNIKLMGSIPQQDLEKWYQKSSFFMLGSHKEGGPVSLIEAMACGCIPIVTDIAPFKAMTNNGDCGLLFSPGDFKNLSLQLKELETLDKEKLRNKTLKQFENHLSHQAIASKITKNLLGI
jgi:glycosyltransferase involved in cell wall biosynthesis